MIMVIAIGSDHGGYECKEHVVSFLNSKGYKVIDVGTFSKDSCNYPDYAFKVANNVASGVADKGILICTSGEGVTIAANKVKGIRCGIGYNDDVSHLIVEHNHANIIAFGAAFMELKDITRRIEIFLNAKEEGGRHDIRVKLIADFEQNQ